MSWQGLGKLKSPQLYNKSYLGTLAMFLLYSIILYR